MQMKYYLSVLLLLVTILPAMSGPGEDTKPQRKRFQLGVGFNVNSSWMTGFDRAMQSTSRITEESLDGPKIGLGLAVLSFNYFVSPRFSVSLSPQFDMYGARYKYYETLYHELGVTDKSRIVTESLNYFQLPVGFNFYITSYLSVHAGIYASALLSARRNDPERKQTTEYDDWYRHSSSEDVDHLYREADLGCTAGVGLEFGRFKVAATYMHGVLNVSNIIDGTHYNRSVNLSLIFNFVNKKYK